MECAPPFARWYTETPAVKLPCFNSSMVYDYGPDKRQIYPCYSGNMVVHDTMTMVQALAPPDSPSKFLCKPFHSCLARAEII